MTGSAGTSAGGSGDSGASAFRDFIDTTIFSRSIEVMCFSLRAPPSVLASRINSGRARAGSDFDEKLGRSSEELESTLEESSGTWSSAAVFRLRSKCKRGDNDGSGAQQKASRLNNRQLRFSSRFPFSIASAHLCSTVVLLVSKRSRLQSIGVVGRSDIPDHRPCRSITLRVSMASMELVSKFKSDFCALKGILRVREHSLEGNGSCKRWPNEVCWEYG